MQVVVTVLHFLWTVLVRVFVNALLCISNLVPQMISCVFNLFLFFSVTEVQNARGIMDVLAEMLSALDPGKREV